MIFLFRSLLFVLIGQKNVEQGAAGTGGGKGEQQDEEQKEQAGGSQRKGKKT